ncbi:MAG: hypothetical protein ACE5F6_18300 [Anaerolineae bacterium]
MRSGEYRPKEQLDKLIQQALIDSVADEEPPARVWERIRARLTQPDRPPSFQWSGPVLQAAMLILLLMLGSLSVWQKWSGEQVTGVPSGVSTATPLALHATDAAESRGESSGAVADAAEIVLLREYSSLQTRSLIVKQLRRRAPGVAVPAYDIPPHPGSPQAKALLPESPHETGPAGLPVYAPGPIW